MPYITQERRDENLPDCGNIDISHSRRDLGIAVGYAMENGGDFQYMIAEAIQTYLERKGLRYARCEEIKGALHGAVDEFHDLVVKPYEAKKASENGGVYNLSYMKNKAY